MTHQDDFIIITQLTHYITLLQRGFDSMSKNMSGSPRNSPVSIFSGDSVTVGSCNGICYILMLQRYRANTFATCTTVGSCNQICCIPFLQLYRSKLFTTCKTAGGCNGICCIPMQPYPAKTVTTCNPISSHKIKPPPAETQSDQEDDEDVPPAVRKFLKDRFQIKSTFLIDCLLLDCFDWLRALFGNLDRITLKTIKKGAKPHKSCPAQPRDSVPEQRKLDRKPGGGLGKCF